MRFASIGLRVESQPALNESRRRQAGFTLLEALVALGVVLIFAGVLGPFLFQARRITTNAEGRLAAHNVLRSLVDNPLQRPSFEHPVQEGETVGLRWRLVAEPISVGFGPALERTKWMSFQITASVFWGPDQFVTAQTIRLGQHE